MVGNLSSLNSVFPLTLTLSLREREPGRPRWMSSCASAQPARGLLGHQSKEVVFVSWPNQELILPVGERRLIQDRPPQGGL